MHHKKVLIADPQVMFTEGLVALLSANSDYNLKVEKVQRSSESLMINIKELEIDIVILDLNLPDEDGLDLIPVMRTEFPDLRICVLSSYTDIKLVKGAFQAGADGYVSKNNSVEELTRGFSEMFDGHTFLAKGLRITPANNRNRKSNNTSNTVSNYEDGFIIKQKLTRREQEILQLITEAKNNKEIASELYISDQTVGVHRKNIMRKLGVRNTVNLIKFALEYQLV